jgi:cytoskeletal protein CcmA (bactofilin family)
MAKMNKETITVKWDTRIGNTAVVEGSVISDGSVSIEGTVKGAVSCRETGVVQDGAKLNGTLEAENACIAGSVEGNIKARNAVAITSAGNVKGDIDSSSLTVAPGVVFDGNCHMSGKSSVVSSFSGTAQPCTENSVPLEKRASKLLSNIKHLLGIKNTSSSS